MANEFHLEKIAEIYNRDPIVGGYMIGVSEILSRGIENYLEDNKFYNKSFDILLRNLVDFYVTLENHFGELRFRGLYKKMKNFGTNFESSLERLTLNESNPVLKSIHTVAEDTTNSFRDSGVYDSLLLDGLYKKTLASCILLYDALKK